MNEYFKYEHFDLWDPEIWKDRYGLINDLFQWIGELDPFEEIPYELPEGAYAPVPSDVNGFEGYMSPEEAAFWEEKNTYVELRHIGSAQWIAMVPKEAMGQFDVTYPAVITMHQEKISDPCDPCWPMKALIKYHDFAVEMAEEKRILMIVVTDGPDVNREYSGIMMEACSLFPIDYNHIWLDVTPVYETGHTLEDLPGKLPCNEKGDPMVEPDKQVVPCGASHKVLDISKTWIGNGSTVFAMCYGLNGKGAGNADYDAQKLIRTNVALRLTEPMQMEYQYLSCEDEGFLNYWESHGVLYEEHDSNHQRWVSMVPRNAMEDPSKKLPLMLIFQEVYYFNNHLPVEAAATWFEYCKLVMQGEMMLVFFACESEEQNDYMAQVYAEAVEQYPVDISRVYTTGFSHNGGNASTFAFHHPDIITALAGGLLGMVHGSTPEEEDQLLAARREIDLPCVWTNGLTEHFMPNGELTFESDRFMGHMKRGALKAYNCRQRTEEDFKDAYESDNIAFRKNGVPGDRSEVLFLEGVPHYIVDVDNLDGKCHLRFIAVENMPHFTLPTKMILEWSFVRRFARDPETHQIYELY